MMLGCGDSSARAREDLARNLERYRERYRLPRPGTAVAIEMAAALKAQPLQTFGAAFVARVFDVESVFFTDESSLWDYCPDGSLDEAYRRLRELYGVDVSDIAGANLVKVLERIRSAR